MDLVASFTIINLYNSTEGLADYYSWASHYYILDIAYCPQIVNYLDEYKCQYMYVVGNSEFPEYMRAIDTRHSYETYDFNTDAIVNYDFYEADRDKSYMTNPNILICYDNFYDSLPDYIRFNYKEIDTIHD